MTSRALVRGAGDRNTASSGGPEIRRTFVLTKRDRRGLAKGVFALIIAEDQDANELHDLLFAVFKKRDPANVLRGDSKEKQLANLLHDALPQPSPDRRQPAVVVAVSLGSEVIVCAIGAKAILCGYRQEVDIFQLPFGSPHAGIQVSRVPVEEGDHLVLLGPDDGQFLQKGEFKEATLGCPTPRTAAQWLTALMASRGHPVTDVVVGSLWPNPDSALIEPSRRIRLPGLNSALFAMGAILAIALVLGAFVRFAIEGKSHKAALLQVPTQLSAKISAPAHALLRWKPMAGAKSYLITFGREHFSSSSPRLLIPGSLRPGSTYKWTVRAGYRGKESPASSTASLHVPLLLLPTLSLVGPKGSPSIKSGQAVQFCWQTRLVGQQFTVRISGPGVDVRKTLPSSALDRDRSSLCYGHILPSSASYSWRVAAAEGTYRSQLSSWLHFRIRLTGSAKNGKRVAKKSSS